MSLLDTASLIVTPNAVKEGKLYSVIPSDGSGDMSVVRATTATRVNSAGLVELVPYNIIRYSQEFDNASWSYYQATITPNVITAPDGTMTGDRLNQATGTGGNVVYSNETLSTGNITLSAYLKLGTGSFGAVSLYDGSWKNGYFNLTTGSVHYTDPGVTASIQDAGNGWYRCIITINSVSNSVTTNVGHVLNTGEFGYIWGAQLVEGSTAKDYQKTETRLNIPRLDYSNGICPSLLVEPQRTNIATNSENFATYTTFQASVTSNDTTAPNGLQTADKITTTGSGSGSVYIPSVSLATGSNTASCYFKAGNSNLVAIDSNGSGGYWGASFNLSNQTYTLFGITSSASIEEVGNGWYRCSVTASTSSTAYLAFGVIGNTGSTAYAWGAQLEVGSYATSYIPTTSASVTRNADKLFKTSATALIGQTEGTIFAEFANPAKEAGARYFSLSDGTAGDRIDVYAVSPTEIGIYASKSYGVIVNTSFVVPANLPLKYAVAYKAGQWAWYLNGVQIGTSSNTNIPTLTDIQLTTDPGQGAAAGGNPLNAAALWKTRLTNTQLSQLTTI